MTVDEYVAALVAYDPGPDEHRDILVHLARLWDELGIPQKTWASDFLWLHSVRFWSATHGEATALDPVEQERLVRQHAAPFMEA